MRRSARSWHPVLPWAALSIAAHVAIALVAGREPVPAATPRVAALTVRLVERTAPPGRAAVIGEARRESPRAAAVRPRAATVARHASVAAVASVDVPPPPSPAPEEISGAVFALPQLGFGGAAARSNWMRSAAPTAPPPPPAQPLQPDPRALAQAQREGGRAQLVAALEQRLGALAPPLTPGEGSCRLAAQAEPAELDCDNAALHDAVTPQAAALSDLLQAYRSLDSRTGGLLIGYSRGHYEVTLAMTERRD